MVSVVGVVVAVYSYYYAFSFLLLPPFCHIIIVFVPYSSSFSFVPFLLGMGLQSIK